MGRAGDGVGVSYQGYPLDLQLQPLPSWGPGGSTSLCPPPGWEASRSCMRSRPQPAQKPRAAACTQGLARGLLPPGLSPPQPFSPQKLSSRQTVLPSSGRAAFIPSQFGSEPGPEKCCQRGAPHGTQRPAPSAGSKRSQGSPCRGPVGRPAH